MNEEEFPNYQPMFDNARKIRDLVRQIHELSLELLEPPTVGPKPKVPVAAKAASPRTSNRPPRGPRAAKRHG